MNEVKEAGTKRPFAVSASDAFLVILRYYDLEFGPVFSNGVDLFYGDAATIQREETLTIKQYASKEFVDILGLGLALETYWPMDRELAQKLKFFYSDRKPVNGLGQYTIEEIAQFKKEFVELPKTQEERLDKALSNACFAIVDALVLPKLNPVFRDKMRDGLALGLKEQFIAKAFDPYTPVFSKAHENVDLPQVENFGAQKGPSSGTISQSIDQYLNSLDGD